MADGPSKLSDKQEMFCREYIIDLNGAAACRRAGYSANSAHEQASAILARPAVRARVDELLAERAKRLEVTADKVVTELAKIAFGRMSDLAKWTGSSVTFVSSDQIGEPEDAAISEVTQTVTQHGGTLKIKRHDKVKALELIGRHLGMWKDKVEHSGEVKSEVTVVEKDIKERLKQVKGEK